MIKQINFHFKIGSQEIRDSFKSKVCSTKEKNGIK